MDLQVWELVICDPERSFEYAQYYPNNKINSGEVGAGRTLRHPCSELLHHVQSAHCSHQILANHCSHVRVLANWSHRAYCPGPPGRGTCRNAVC